MPRTKRVKPLRKLLPTVTVAKRGEAQNIDAFPIEAFSASSMIEFSTNPFMFKVKHINRERFDSTTNISAVVGKAFHRAMEVYYSKDLAEVAEGDAIAVTLKAGQDFLSEYPEGSINWSTTIKNRQSALERLTLGINSYIAQSDRSREHTLFCEEDMRSSVDIEWKGERLTLPVPFKGRLDRVTRTKDEANRLKVRDYKTCTTFSDLDKIDGCKIIQAITYYLLCYAVTGEPPYSLVYEEVKLTKNQDGSPQVREHEIVFEENDLYFDFYFRLYKDMVRALNGEMVYVPNVRTMFDNEISIVAYLQGLDITEEAAKRMKERKVKTITDLLRKEITTKTNANKLLTALDGKLAEVKAINYADMTTQDKIATKMREHSIPLQFHDIVAGASVDLYRFTPSIGVKMSRLRQYADDIQQVTEATSVRIVAPIPGTSFVGIEIPRPDRRFPSLPPVDGYNLAIGETVTGEVCRLDIRLAPHLLIGGASGSGKSILLTSLIDQILQIKGAELRIYDPKRVDFRRYKDKVTEYQCEPENIEASLFYLADLMESRYDALAAQGQVNAIEAGMPPIFVVIDEYADLAGRKDSTVPHNIMRLAQKGRAAGIHIILATQRASTKIISGDIKVNFPTKIVLRMAKAVDSEVMIDEGGAEKLLGKGDMLLSSEFGIERLQGYKS